VMGWEAPGGDRVGVRHGQFAEAHVAYALGEVGRSGQLSGGLLDGDLPQADRGQDNVRVVGPFFGRGPIPDL
jgi:hypothetical protein